MRLKPTRRPKPETQGRSDDGEKADDHSSLASDFALRAFTGRPHPGLYHARVNDY